MTKIIIHLGLAFLIAASAAAGHAAERVLLAPPPPTSVSGKSAVAAETGVAPKETVRGEIAELRAKAARHGTVRVIVGYRVAFAAEGALVPEELALQQKEIAAAGESLRKTFPEAGKRAGGIRTFATIPFAGMVVTAKELDQLQADPNVITIVEDIELQPMMTKSLPLIGATLAHAAGATGKGQVVAVVDNRFQWDHPFLRDSATGKSKIVYEKNMGDGATGEGATNRGSGPITREDNHGTAVAGIIAGSRPATAQGGAMSGVAPDARLMVFGTRYQSEQIASFQEVYSLRNRFNIAAVNLSWGNQLTGSSTTCDMVNPAMTAAINNLREAGIATVISAGNFYETFPNTLAWPACISTAVSVGAVYDSVKQGYNCPGLNAPIAPDVVACLSQSSPNLSLLAPTMVDTSALGGGYFEFGGTSAAAPHVAGAFAVLKSKVPTASVSEILEALRATGKPVKDYRNGRITPRIDIAKAIGYLEANNKPGIDYLATGDGWGTVSFSPAGTPASCRKNCTVPYPPGTKVTMTARADQGSYFLGWAGAGGQCGEADTCTVTVSASTTAVAQFARPGAPVNLNVTVGGAGKGRVFVDTGDATWLCKGDCTVRMLLGRSAGISLQPAPGSVIGSWSGVCKGTSGWCGVTATSRFNRVGVTFDEAPGPLYTITYSKTGAGKGKVIAAVDNTVLDCEGNCSHRLPAGTVVTLWALPEDDTVFTGWSGACTGTVRKCTVKLGANASAVGSFLPTQNSSNVTLNYSKAGDGAGQVSATINGVTTPCTSTCSTTQRSGTAVTLTAQAGASALFSGWSGACTGTASTCTVTLRTNASAVATFLPKPSSNVTLSYMKIGPGTITATVNGRPTSCAMSCTISQPAGTQVILTAHPGPNGEFRNWSGSCTGTSPTCTLSLRAGGVVLATFQTRPAGLASSR